MNETAQQRKAVWPFKVNGEAVAVNAPEDMSLLMALRQDLDLKGTRVGCSEGNCGACTVLIDGRPTQSCTTPIYAAKDHDVLTIEGLLANGVPGSLQQAFVDEQAAQCGYCINGIIMMLAGLLGRSPPADRREIVAMLDERHLCRCGAHSRILRAIDRAIADQQGRQT